MAAGSTHAAADGRLKTRPLRRSDPLSPSEVAELELSIGHRFEQQARRHGERLAIKSEGACVTYAELNQNANRIAHTIRAALPAGNQRVVLVLREDAGFFAVLLGVLKAGKAVVILDPSAPPARTQQILKDAQAGLVLTAHGGLSAAQVAAQAGCAVMNLDELSSTVAHDDPAFEVPPSTQAGLIYTSGSTGQPKGVIQTHRTFLRSVLAFTQGYELRTEDRVCLLASCGAAQGLVTVLSTLLNGATVHLFDIKQQGMETLPGFLIRERVTVFISGSTVFRHLVNALTEKDRFPDLRLVRLGSEAIRLSDVDLFHRHFGAGCSLINALASTETGPVTGCFVEGIPGAAERAVPVGWAVAGVEVLLLDDQAEEVGANQEGQIVIRGRYLSPGYWRRPELTGQVFKLANDGSGDGLYFTGDLGVKAEDGCLRHAGRKDFRVKIRGFTVELGEIEAALSSHPEVCDGVVSVRPDQRGDNQLAAYFVTSPDSSLAPGELRAWLRTRLPEQMVPALLLPLAKLPQTPDGKVDRAALPDPASLQPVAPIAGALPQLPLHREILSVWETLLPTRPIGITDSFFDLGGHSLLAMEMLKRVGGKVGKKLPVRLLLQKPSIERLAAFVLEDRGGDEAPDGLELNREGTRVPLILVELTAGTLGLARLMGADPTQPVYILPIADIQEARVLPSMAGIAVEQVRQLRAMRTKGPYVLGGYCFGGLIAFEMARLLQAAGEEVRLVVMVDSPTRENQWSRALVSVAGLAGRCLGWSNRRTAERVVRWIKRADRFEDITRKPLRLMAKELWSTGRAKLQYRQGPAQPTAGDALVFVWGEAYYRWMMAGFRMHRYGGQTLVLAAEGKAGQVAHLSSRWPRWAPGVEVEPTSGTHASCIGEHLPETAARLRKHLDRLALAHPPQENCGGRAGSRAAD